jgi:hypothetical protein
MTGKWRWLIWVMVALIMLRTAIVAFRAPWTWNPDQCLVTILAAAILIVAVWWAYIRTRYGAEGFRERWTARRRRLAAPLPKNFYSWSLAFWIVVALGLVVFFNVMEKH